MKEQTDVKNSNSLKARLATGTSTWGNLTTSRLYQQSGVEFGEKMCKLKAEDNYVYSLVKAPKTQKIVCLLWIRELQCTMLSKGEFLSSDTMDTLRRSKNTNCDLPRRWSSANKRVSTSVCSRSRSVRDSAITRWNASDSMASSVLLKTRIFLWAEKRRNSTIVPK